MNSETPSSPTSPHCGYVAIVGAPNAGKSTLLNQLVGAKVSIVSSKVQTTRARITAIAMEGETQIVFVDTPGIFKPKRRLDRAMVAAAWSGIDEADAVLLLIDAAKGFDDESRAIVDALNERKRKNVLLALNKIDTIAREKLLGLAKTLNDAYPFEQTFMISASKGSGVDDVRRALAKLMPAGPWLYPEDQLADVPMRFLAAEITREQVYRALHDELPYATTVETENWKDQKDGSARIEQVIFVEREGQKKIVLGEKGSMIKRIGAAARLEMEKQFERRVHLFLFVKVREDWGDDPERYEAMGLDFPKA
ncbi:GTPase Era [uncultured Ferrovibrio sp.]|jgi:GTP-binding protein Era|uniref:GTPase Era n=1 Tax=uncultured Ferrovibrio sp. TaxID=1576913 RepID=UPI002624AF3C|nr:GTPase Era [uncultured Ferrovibrio sp.]